MCFPLYTQSTTISSETSDVKSGGVVASRNGLPAKGRKRQERLKRQTNQKIFPHGHGWWHELGYG